MCCFVLIFTHFLCLPPPQCTYVFVFDNTKILYIEKKTKQKKCHGWVESMLNCVERRLVIGFSSCVGWCRGFWSKVTDVEKSHLVRLSPLKTVLLPVFDLNRVRGGGGIIAKSIRNSSEDRHAGFPRYPHFTLFFPHFARFTHGHDIWRLVLLCVFFLTLLFLNSFKVFYCISGKYVFFVFLVHVVYMHLFFSSPLPFPLLFLWFIKYTFCNLSSIVVTSVVRAQGFYDPLALPLNFIFFRSALTRARLFF